MDRRNTLGKPLCGFFVLQGLSRALVELSRYGTESCLAIGRHIDAAWEVLAQKAISSQINQRSGKKLSPSSINGTLREIRSFFGAVPL